MHWYAITLYTATWILCTQLLHVLTPLLYRLTGLHVLIVYLFLLHRSWFIWLLHAYSCIPVTWLFSVTDIDIPVTWLFHVTDIDISVIRHVSCWYAMCESHIYCFHFPLSCFMLSKELMSCYHVTYTMHCTCSRYTV